MILLCFPMLTDVLSTESPTQLVQGMFRDSSTFSMAAKILADVAEAVPDVRHMSKNFVVT